jgi:hypothetical protein
MRAGLGLAAPPVLQDPAAPVPSLANPRPGMRARPSCLLPRGVRALSAAPRPPTPARPPALACLCFFRVKNCSVACTPIVSVMPARNRSCVCLFVCFFVCFWERVFTAVGHLARSYGMRLAPINPNSKNRCNCHRHRLAVFSSPRPRPQRYGMQTASGGCLQPRPHAALGSRCPSQAGLDRRTASPRAL